MSSINITTTEADKINEITNTFIKIWCYPIFFFGLIGHMLSIRVFMSRSLRSSSCSCYFLASTFSGIGVVTMNILLRLLQNAYQINIYLGSLVVCRILTWLFMWNRAQYAWYIVLASVDRFLCSSTSVSCRALSSVRIALRIVPITMLLVGITYSHVLIYFQINVRQQTCVPMPGIYQQFFSAWHLVAFSFVPPVLMICFGISTIRNIQQSIARVVNRSIPYVNRLQHHRKFIERQLLRMMLAQSGVFIFTGSLPAINYLYTSIRPSVVLDGLQVAEDNLLYNIAGFVSLTVPSMSFYLFILSSNLFRKELIRIFRKQWNSIQLTTTFLLETRKHESNALRDRPVACITRQ